MAKKSDRVKRPKSPQRGAELAYKNALLLLPEAEILHGRGSYGHSAALSMHAIEELGKAEILIMWKERIHEVPDWRTARYRKKPVLITAPSDWLKHPHKYWHFLNCLKLGEIVARRVSSRAAVSNHLIPLFTSGKRDKHYDDLRFRFREGRRLDQSRQRAIFVDYSKGKWSSPSDLDMEWSKALFESWAKAYAGWVDQIVRNGWRRTVGPIRKLVESSTIATKPLVAVLQSEHAATPEPERADLSRG